MLHTSTHHLGAELTNPSPPYVPARVTCTCDMPPSPAPCPPPLPRSFVTRASENARPAAHPGPSVSSHCSSWTVGFVTRASEDVRPAARPGPSVSSRCSSWTVGNMAHLSHLDHLRRISHMARHSLLAGRAVHTCTCAHVHMCTCAHVHMCAHLPHGALSHLTCVRACVSE